MKVQFNFDVETEETKEFMSFMRDAMREMVVDRRERRSNHVSDLECENEQLHKEIEKRDREIKDIRRELDDYFKSRNKHDCNCKDCEDI